MLSSNISSIYEVDFSTTNERSRCLQVSAICTRVANIGLVHLLLRPVLSVHKKHKHAAGRHAGKQANAEEETHRPRTPPKTTRSVPMIAAECPDRAVGDLPDMAGGYSRSMSAVERERRGAVEMAGVREGVKEVAA